MTRKTCQSKLTLCPSVLTDAKKFVAEVHRHHGPPVGHRFSSGVVDEAGEMRGVMCMGRAVAKSYDQYAVLEVTRVATDGCPNACSFLYGAACRIHRVHGFIYAQTYTLISEPGTSLLAAGWKPVGVTEPKPKGWDVPGRRRDNTKHPTEQKIRWECRCGPTPRIELAACAGKKGAVTMDAVERAKVIDWLTREHRNEVYEALLRRAEERGSTIHEDIIAAWKANHLEEVRPIARGGLRPSLVPLYRIKETSTPSTVCEHGNYGPSCDQCHRYVEVFG